MVRRPSTILKPLTLHGHKTGPNPIKIAIALEALEVPYEVKLWEFGDAENGVKGPALLRLNENGRVPVLEDPNTGVVSWESGAVMNYVRRTYDRNNDLGPRGNTEQDRVDFEKWEYFLLTTLGPMMGQVNWFRHYHAAANDDALARYEAQTYRCFDVLEAQLARHGGDFILPGDAPSAVDLHHYPWLQAYEFAGLSLQKYPQTQAWLERCGKLEPVQRALEKIANGEKV